MRHEERIVTVSKTGQISIGKQWGGKQVRLEYMGNHIVITPGVFIPEEDADFYSRESLEIIKDFETWTKDNPPHKTDLKALARMRRNREG